MSELDDYLGPRAYTLDPDGVSARVTAADFCGDLEPPPPEPVMRIAEMLCRLRGLEYGVCGEATRKQARQAGRSLLRNARGDLAGVLDLEAQYRGDANARRWLNNCTSFFTMRDKLVVRYDECRAFRHDDQADRAEYLRYRT